MPNISIYMHRVVQQVQDFYGPLLDISKFQGNIGAHLNLLADRLFEGLNKGNEAALTEANNYHPDLLGIPVASLKTMDFSLEIARQIIASEYGFENLHIAMQHGIDYDPLFEEAVFLLLQGNTPALRARLAACPELLLARSNYGHGATLLHYTATNGVEIWRQIVPENIPEIAQLLISLGGDKNATMSVYGGEHTPYSLAASSAHPRDAGIASELLAALE